MQESPAKPVLNSIPDPDTVRAMLVQSVRETQVLRALLRAAEKKERLAGRRAAEGGQHGG